jgi:hypothetical protein
VTATFLVRCHMRRYSLPRRPHRCALRDFRTAAGCFGCVALGLVSVGGTAATERGDGVAPPTPLIRTVRSDTPSSARFGASLAFANLDNTGPSELIVGVPGENRVAIYDGSTGALVRQLSGAPSEQLGAAIVNLGRVVGSDRNEDVALGGAGVVLISGRDAVSPTGSGLGVAAGDPSAITSLGDLDRDGAIDFALGFESGDGGVGRVVVLSGNDRRELFRLSSSSSGDRFGRAIAALADINGDGRRDIAVGAPGTQHALSDPPAGEVRLFSGSDGKLLGTIAGTSVSAAVRGERFGETLLNPGDLDGDGLDDLVVGSPAADVAPFDGSRDGTVRIFSGAALARGGLTDLRALAGGAHEALGEDLVRLGDIDGDRRGDIVVTRRGRGAHARRLYVEAVSGRTGDVTARLGVPVEPGERIALAGGADIDGDGIGDLGVGLPSAGRIDVVSGARLLRR